jgi:hypothetical protein
MDDLAFDPTTCRSLFATSTGGPAPPQSAAGPSISDPSSGGGTSGTGTGQVAGPRPLYGGGATCTNPFQDLIYYPRAESCLTYTSDAGESSVA